jgi:Histidine kinase-, DNA gyrase B-, and HSP90-like ATPase
VSYNVFVESHFLNVATQIYIIYFYIYIPGYISFSKCLTDCSLFVLVSRHELHCLLHGILVTTEFTEDTYVCKFRKSLLDTMNVCGCTLFDTMKQVLDINEVVTLENSWRTRDLKDGTEHVAMPLDNCALEDVAVAEEVVEGVCLGYSYSRTISSRHLSYTSPANLPIPSSDVNTGETRSSDVEIIMDIAPGDWVYKTQSDALRRIIMNIFNNAMKNTDRGRVSLQLETVSNQELHFDEQDQGEVVVLTASNTSKGISEDFLRTRLCRPFVQEDTETSLELSIVRNIVESLNGHISIRSIENEGTIVRVSLPLARAPQGESLPERQLFTEADLLRQGYGKKSVAMLGFHPDAAEKRPGLWRVLERYITEWFGLKLVSWPSCGPVDLLLADENDLDCYNKYFFTDCPSTMLVLCNGAMYHSTTYQHAWHPPADLMDFIYQPFGPHKLAKKIHSCMQRLPVSVTSSSKLQDQNPALADSTRVDSLPFDRSDALPTPDIEAEQFPGFTRSWTDNEHSNSTKALAADFPPTPEEQPSDQSPVVWQGPSRRQSAPAAPVVPEYHQTIICPELPSINKYSDSPPKSQMIKVLVVDDNQINLQLMITFMRRRNFSVLESADNGKLAVDAVERQDGYDIIFMGW